MAARTLHDKAKSSAFNSLVVCVYEKPYKNKSPFSERLMLPAPHNSS